MQHGRGLGRQSLLGLSRAKNEANAWNQHVKSDDAMSSFRFSSERASPTKVESGMGPFRAGPAVQNCS